jgi:hypothetical protein
LIAALLKEIVEFKSMRMYKWCGFDVGLLFYV